MLNDDIKHLSNSALGELLAKHRRNLSVLTAQSADYGIHPPLILVNQISEITNIINIISDELLSREKENDQYIDTINSDFTKINLSRKQKIDFMYAFKLMHPQKPIKMNWLEKFIEDNTWSLEKLKKGFLKSVMGDRLYTEMYDRKYDPFTPENIQAFIGEKLLVAATPQSQVRYLITPRGAAYFDYLQSLNYEDL